MTDLPMPAPSNDLTALASKINAEHDEVIKHVQQGAIRFAYLRPRRTVLRLRQEAFTCLCIFRDPLVPSSCAHSNRRDAVAQPGGRQRAARCPSTNRG